MAALKQSTGTTKQRTLKPDADVAAMKRDPVFTWAFKSSKPRAGGAFATYITRLNDDCSLSCDCAGWTIKRAGKPRGCKHTKRADVAGEAVEIFEKWKRGESLPILDLATGEKLNHAQSPNGEQGVSTKARFGRVLEMD